MARTGLRFSQGNAGTFLTGHALADEGKITVFAAASLMNAMCRILLLRIKEKKRRRRLLFRVFFCHWRAR